MQSTDLQFVNMNTWLATVPAENDITCTVTGPVEMDVWPVHDTSNQQASGARVWVKRELWSVSPWSPNVAARTDSVPVGTGVGAWSCAAHTGQSGSGPVSTFVASFDVTSAPVTSWSLGQGNRAGYGGFPLSNLPGSVANKSITSQSTSGALAIFSQSSRIAWAGTYGSTTRTVGTPSTGAAAYTATVHDSALGQDWTISLDVSATQLNAAPATGDTASSSQLTTIATDTLCAGDDVVVEGDFPGFNATLTSPVPAACAATPSIAPPTSPYAPSAADPTGWRPDGPLTAPPTVDAGILTVDPGWITFHCRFVLSCRINTAPTSSSNVLIFNRGSGGVAPSYFRMANVRDTIYPATQGVGLNGIAFVMQDHSEPIYDVNFTTAAAAGVNWNHEADWAQALFLNDNYVNTISYTTGAAGPQSGILAGSMSINSRDGQEVGNVWDHTKITNASTTVDKIGALVYNASIGSGHSAVSWNFVKNTQTDAGAHIDYIQPAMTAGNNLNGLQSIYRGLASNSTVEVGDYIGNIFSRGVGNYVSQATLQGQFTGTGSVSGAVLTVNTVTAGAVSTAASANYLTGPAIPAASPRITAQTSGVAGGPGTYTLNVSAGTIGLGTIYGGFASANQLNAGYPGSTEGIFIKNSGPTTYRSDILHLLRLVGNIIDDNNQHGMDIMVQADGSVVANNLNTFDYALLQGNLNSPGCPNAPCLTPSGSFGGGKQTVNGFEINEGPGIKVYRNVHANLGLAYYLSGGAATTFADNYMPNFGTTTLTDLTNAQGQWTNPACGEACQTIQSFIDHFTPVTASTLGTVTGTGKHIGPFPAAGVAPLIDYRRRTYSAAILTP